MLALLWPLAAALAILQPARGLREEESSCLDLGSCLAACLSQGDKTLQKRNAGDCNK